MQITTNLYIVQLTYSSVDSYIVELHATILDGLDGQYFKYF